MHLEYDWTFNVYRPRFMGTFIDIGGERSFETIEHARLALLSRGLKLGKKTDTRTWEIVLNEERV